MRVYHGGLAYLSPNHQLCITSQEAADDCLSFVETLKI